jgi:hypothetical protein
VVMCAGHRHPGEKPEARAKELRSPVRMASIPSLARQACGSRLNPGPALLGKPAVAPEFGSAGASPSRPRPPGLAAPFRGAKGDDRATMPGQFTGRAVWGF